MKRKAQLGFGLGLGGGLGDIVVPLATLGILGWVMYSAYQDYKQRGRVIAAIKSVAPAQAAIEKMFAKSPADMSQLTGSLPPATADLRSAVIARDGTITLAFPEDVAPAGNNVVQIVPVSGGKPVDLSQPAAAGRKFEWQCGRAAGKTTLAEKLRPADCR